MTQSISPALRDTDATFVTDWFFLSGDLISLIFVGPEDEQLNGRFIDETLRSLQGSSSGLFSKDKCTFIEFHIRTQKT